MSSKPLQEKTRLHIRNRNRERYDLKALLTVNPELADYLKQNNHGHESVDFSSPVAVKLLNKALLNHYYGITYWEFPDKNLCPPIPGRADYIHYMADVLSQCNFGRIPKGDNVICLDIGIGASCIYPIIGVVEYGWKYIGSDIDPKSIRSSEKIVSANPLLSNKITCRLQKDSKDVFQGIINNREKIDLTICNPPFHSSIQEAQKGTRRKVKNLSGKNVKNPQLNFAGISNELIYKGGELRFVTNMVRESKKFDKNCFWFSTLVSKQSNLKGIYKELKKVRALEVKTIPMGTGNKTSRIVVWTFLSKTDQQQWQNARWKTK